MRSLVIGFAGRTYHIVRNLMLRLTSENICLKVLWIFNNIFETLNDLNGIDEKTKMLKTPS